MNILTYADEQSEEQIIDQYLSGDTACRLFATLEYYTFRSVQQNVPGIFAKYNGKNNSGLTKSLENLKRQLKTHILSFLLSHQDMVKSYGSYPFPNNFTENEIKNFILTCQNIVNDPEVKVYCALLLSIIKKDYQKVLKYFKNIKTDKKPEMDPQRQIDTLMPAIGESTSNQEKALKKAREGNFVHSVDINELAKKRALIQGNFIRCLNNLQLYLKEMLSEDFIDNELQNFYHDFKSNESFFQYPHGYDENYIEVLISNLEKNNNKAKNKCKIFKLILQKDYKKVDEMLNL